jgi:CRISPR system Cascade subunit CasB
MGSLSQSLLEFLRERRGDRGAMANLRCALVESKRHRAWPLLARFRGIGDDFSALAVQYLAGFYATHPQEEGMEGNFGETCRRLLSDDERQKAHSSGEPGPISRRFQHLLAAQGEEVFSRVLRLVVRAKAEGVPVNYGQLFDDLMQWRLYPETIRVRWARSFWASMAEEVP